MRKLWKLCYSKLLDVVDVSAIFESRFIDVQNTCEFSYSLNSFNIHDFLRRLFYPMSNWCRDMKTKNIYIYPHIVINIYNNLYGIKSSSYFVFISFMIHMYGCFFLPEKKNRLNCATSVGKKLTFVSEINVFFFKFYIWFIHFAYSVWNVHIFL